MSELTVEPVESVTGEDAAPVGVDAPEYVLYGGKGGVGKTTCAAATALASARDGTTTLVASTDPAHSLSDVLDVDVPAEPGRLETDEPLYGVEIDPETADGPFAGLGPDAGAAPGGPGESGEEDGPFETGLGGLGDLVGDGDSPLGGVAPGADEAAAMGLLLEYLDDNRFERVVVDTAPTGHTLRLFELPDVMDTVVGRLLALRERLSGMTDRLGDAVGVGTGANGSGVDDLRELADRIERLQAALSDPGRTDFRVVMTPRELSVVETERLIDRLEAFNVPVSTLVVNRVTADLTGVADVDGSWFVRPDTEDCAFCKRRWEVQRVALDRAQSLFRGRTVHRVPLFAEPVHGESMLGVVAACLE